MTKIKKRFSYLLIFLFLLFIEVMIALFIHDRFIRPYIGDILVVVVIACFMRICLPDGVKLLPLYIFAFAAGIEVLQYFDFVTMLGWGSSKIASIALGSTFDIVDIVCYAIGCGFLGVIEWVKRKKLGDLI